jgi:hypothetical protein
MVKDIDQPSIIIQADVALDAAQKAQDLAAIKNAMIRAAERQAFLAQWITEDAIKARKAKLEAEAEIALARGKEAASFLRQVMPKYEDGLPAINYFRPTFRIRE